MTGKIINLRQTRKRKQREAASGKADANAALHGRTRAERDREKAVRETQIRHLDGHRLNDQDD